MDNIIWGDVATWITAIGTCILGLATIALFIVGFLQIRTERNSRLLRQAELATLSRRDQAEQVAAWLLGHMTYDEKNKIAYQWIAVLNQSRQPVYSAIINAVPMTQTRIKRVENNPNIVCIDLIPPGQGYFAMEGPSMAHPGHSLLGVEIAFQDKGGVNWFRDANGNLSELQQSPVEHFQIDLPTTWGGLQAELPPTSYPPA